MVLINIKLKNNKIKLNVYKLSEVGKFIGLMFKSRGCKNLMFNFNSPGRWSIHSFFVFFDFMAIWVDDKNNVINWKIVKPFTFKVTPKKEFSTLIELPLNEMNKKLIRYIVDKGKGLNIDDAFR
jgi:uncharacterized membrane protein (UPF0127 family)